MRRRRFSMRLYAAAAQPAPCVELIRTAGAACLAVYRSLSICTPSHRGEMLRPAYQRASRGPMINRRAFVSGLGAVLAAPLAADAQQAGKIWRIGFISV